MSPGKGKNMLAAVYKAGHGLRIEERLRPAPGPGEALLQVAACGICGTDLRIQATGHRRLPPEQSRILGHELSGTVVEVGDGVTSLQPGMRVAVAPNMGCGHCDLCVQGFTQVCPDYISFGVGLDGGFAEYMLLTVNSIEQGNIHPIAEAVSLEEAALLEPLSCCYHGLMACHPHAGETVMVYGAGPIGLMHMQLARVMGASRVIAATSHPERIQSFPSPAADLTLDPRAADFPERLYEANEGRGPDVTIVATPSKQAQSQAVRLAATHGRINFFSGLPKDDSTSQIDSNLVHYHELVITGTTGQTMSDYRACLALLEAGRINLKDLVSHRIPLEQIETAMQAAREHAGLKILVVPQATGMGDSG